MRQGFLKTWLLGLLLGWGLSPAVAHEFWVAPQDYTPVPGARVVLFYRLISQSLQTEHTSTHDLILYP